MFAIRLPRRPARRATAAAELAICLPVLVLLIMASIEACRMIFLDHSLSIASYEGARVAINYDGTTDAVLARCDEILDQRNVDDATISTNPADVSSVESGVPIAVTISAPCEPNMIIPPWFFAGRTLSATTTMVKE